MPRVDVSHHAADERNHLHGLMQLQLDVLMSQRVAKPSEDALGQMDRAALDVASGLRVEIRDDDERVLGAESFADQRAVV